MRRRHRFKIGLVFIKTCRSSILGRIINWILGSAVLSAIVTGLIDDLKEEGAEYVSMALGAIREAATLDVEPEEKFARVRERLIAQFPKESASLLDTVIQTAYRAYSKDLV